MAATVLIVDDHDGFRASARSMLEADGFTVVGESASGLAAVDDAERLLPQVVLLDVQLPDVNGFDVAERLAHARCRPVVVLISSHDADHYGARLGASSSRGFITKRDLNGETLASLLG